MNRAQGWPGGVCVKEIGDRRSEIGIQNPESRIQHPESSIQHPASPSYLLSPIFYLLSLVFFALGLMSKPMLVTLPFVLLLLDYWPLGRVTRDEWRVTGHRTCFTVWPLVLEKLPFFALSIVCPAITLPILPNAMPSILTPEIQSLVALNPPRERS